MNMHVTLHPMSPTSFQFIRNDPTSLPITGDLSPMDRPSTQSHISVMCTFEQDRCMSRVADFSTNWPRAVGHPKDSPYLRLLLSIDHHSVVSPGTSRIRSFLT